MTINIQDIKDEYAKDNNGKDWSHYSANSHETEQMIDDLMLLVAKKMKNHCLSGSFLGVIEREHIIAIKII